jgi:cytoskeleton protein RodZ
VRVLERLNSPIVLVVAVTVFLVLDGLLLYRYQQSLRSAEESAPNAPLEETTLSLGAKSTTAKETTSSLEVEPTTAEETPSSPKEGDGVRVVVEVGSVGGVGLSILEDGQLVYDEVASPGFSEEFEAEEIVTVTAADAGAVQVEVNGEDLGPLGASGEAATRTFTAEAEG